MRLIRPQGPRKTRILRTPFGRIIMTRDRGEGSLLASEVLLSNLCAVHRDGDGVVKDQYDLGSGSSRTWACWRCANDFAWSSSLNLSTLGTQNFHATGTGTTAAAATDFQMQTLASPTTTTAVTGAQSLVAPLTFVGPTSPIYKTVATVNYTTSLAITEWGLHSPGGAVLEPPARRLPRRRRPPGRTPARCRRRAPRRCAACSRRSSFRARQRCSG
jgi:hypothetical protein